MKSEKGMAIMMLPIMILAMVAGMFVFKSSQSVVTRSDIYSEDYKYDWDY